MLTLSHELNSDSFGKTTFVLVVVKTPLAPPRFLAHLMYQYRLNKMPCVLQSFLRTPLTSAEHGVEQGFWEIAHTSHSPR